MQDLTVDENKNLVANYQASETSNIYNNSNKVIDSYETEFAHTVSQVLSFIHFCLGFVSVGLNSFVIYTLAFKRGVCHVHGADVFVIGLTVTDFITGLGLMASIVLAFPSFNEPKYCILLTCTLQSTMLCSAFFLSLMTGDRYFKIVHPFIYQRVCSTDLTPASIAFATYFVSFIVGFIPCFGLEERGNRKICSYLEVISYEFRVSLSVLMFLPVVTAVLLYTKIFSVAKRHIENIAKTMGGTNKVPKGRYIKLIFIIAGIYLIFYLPPVVLSFFVISGSSAFKNESVIQVKMIFHLLSLGLISNSIINPLVYAYTIPAVKNTFRQVIGLPDQEETYFGSSIMADSFVTDLTDEELQGAILEVRESWTSEMADEALMTAYNRQVKDGGGEQDGGGGQDGGGEHETTRADDPEEMTDDKKKRKPKKKSSKRRKAKHSSNISKVGPISDIERSALHETEDDVMTTDHEKEEEQETQSQNMKKKGHKRLKKKKHHADESYDSYAQQNTTESQ